VATAEALRNALCHEWPKLEGAPNTFQAQWMHIYLRIDGDNEEVTISAWNSFAGTTLTTLLYCPAGLSLTAAGFSRFLGGLRQRRSNVMFDFEQKAQDGNTIRVAEDRFYLARDERFAAIALFEGASPSTEAVRQYVSALPVTARAKSLCVRTNNSSIMLYDMDLGRLSLVDDIGNPIVHFTSQRASAHPFSQVVSAPKGGPAEYWLCSRLTSASDNIGTAVAAVFDGSKSRPGADLYGALDSDAQGCSDDPSGITRKPCGLKLVDRPLDLSWFGDALIYSNVGIGSWTVRTWHWSPSGSQLDKPVAISQFRLNGTLPLVYGFVGLPGYVSLSAESGGILSIPLSSDHAKLENGELRNGLGFAAGSYARACLEAALLKKGLGLVPKVCFAGSIDFLNFSSQGAPDASSRPVVYFGYPAYAAVLSLGNQ
jgi:hypothetical protein